MPVAGAEREKRCGVVQYASARRGAAPRTYGVASERFSCGGTSAHDGARSLKSPTLPTADVPESGEPRAHGTHARRPGAMIDPEADSMHYCGDLRSSAAFIDTDGAPSPHGVCEL